MIPTISESMAQGVDRGSKLNKPNGQGEVFLKKIGVSEDDRKLSLQNETAISSAEESPEYFSSNDHFLLQNEIADLSKGQFSEQGKKIQNNELTTQVTLHLADQKNVMDLDGSEHISPVVVEPVGALPVSEILHVDKGYAELNSQKEDMLHEVGAFSIGKLSYIDVESSRDNNQIRESKAPSVHQKNDIHSFKGNLTELNFSAKNPLVPNVVRPSLSAAESGGSQSDKSDRVAAKAALVSAIPDYLKKKVTFVESDGKMNVLIRDYALSEPERREIISSLEFMFKSIGKSVNSILINGVLVVGDKAGGKYAG